MMNYTYHTQVAVNEAHQNELQRKAKQARLVHAYRMQNRSPIYAPLLLRTGKLMASIGNHLVVRYGQAMNDFTEAMQETTAEHSELTV